MTTTLTALEAALLNQIATNTYAPLNGGTPETFQDCGSVWANCLDDCKGPAIVTGRKIPGVVASLSKKGLVCCYGSGSDAQVAMTEAGFEAWKASVK